MPLHWEVDELETIREMSEHHLKPDLILIFFLQINNH